MPQRSKKIGLARSAGAVQKRQSNRYTHLDDQLAKILSSLAHLLLRHGYGHGRLTRLAKIAFVDAARSIGTKPNAKANIARIAALTGLTRVDVSRTLKTDRSIAIGDDHFSRATRVAIGWQTDKAYLDKSGRPRPLPFSTRRIGFAGLVRKYSGDIPARAMLAEMMRLGLVTRNVTGTVSLIRHTPVLPPSAVSTMGAIAPWVNLVADAARAAASTELASHAQQIRIHFNSISEVMAAVRELDARQRSFVAGIQQLGTKNKLNGTYEVTVSVAVATTRPSRSIRKRKNGE